MEKSEAKLQAQQRGLVLRGNWFGKRNHHTECTQCTVCLRAWDTVPPLLCVPRAPYATVCSTCDSAGRAMNCRSYDAVMELSGDQRREYDRLAEAARARRAKKLAQEGPKKLRAARRREVA